MVVVVVIVVIVISMMVMNKMTLSLAQDEEELTATMIRFVEDPEDRTKQARKVIIIITIFTINTTIDAKQEPKVRVPLQLLRLLRSPAPMQEKRNTLDR